MQYSGELVININLFTIRTGWHREFGFMPYGETWRRHRRMFHEYFRPQAIPQYHSAMLKGARGLLELLVNKPTNFLRHIRQ